VFNAEALTPLPGFGLDKSVKAGPFVDVGQVWGKVPSVGDTTMRASAGLAAVWVSPFGPLKFSFAQPLNKKDGDKIQKFQFQMGTTF
jgi:outer membrane protein insertion porin family